MTDTAVLPITAYVDLVEQPMMVAAGEQLSEALGDETGRPWPVRLTFAAFEAPLPDPMIEPIIVASPLADVMALDSSMGSIEAVWRDRLRRLTETAGRTVVLCTIFRHVPDPASRSPVLERIRRLNLLVAHLSHDFAAAVVDLDRTLAFFGAAALGTDYRLGGRTAAEAAGHAVTTSLLAGDLGGHVPAERHANAVRRHGGLHQLAAVVDRRLGNQTHGAGA